MPAAGPAVREIERGRGGELDGNNPACGLGFSERRGLEEYHEEGVAAAVRNVRGVLNPYRSPVNAPGWPEIEDDDLELSEVENYYLCGPSEWSGTSGGAFTRSMWLML